MMAMFRALFPMVYIFRSLFILREQCSDVSDFNKRNQIFTNKVIDIIKFVNHILNSTTDTQ